MPGTATQKRPGIQRTDLRSPASWKVNLEIEDSTTAILMGINGICWYRSTYQYSIFSTTISLKLLNLVLLHIFQRRFWPVIEAFSWLSTHCSWWTGASVGITIHHPSLWMGISASSCGWPVVDAYSFEPPSLAMSCMLEVLWFLGILSLLKMLKSPM